jgi:hypothetical protein
VDPFARGHIYLILLVSCDLIKNLKHARVENSNVPLVDGAAESEVLDLMALVTERNRIKHLKLLYAIHAYFNAERITVLTATPSGKTWVPDRLNAVKVVLCPQDL